MKGKLSQLFAPFAIANKYERLKVLLLTLTYLCMVAGYTLIYDLKNSIFVSVVGREYQPYAKAAAIIVLIPAVLFYSLLVDKLRRYQLLYFYSIAYAVFGILCAYFIGHPTIGIANTVSSPWRLFGWLFFFLVEGFSPFMISVFWAFANSVSDPDSAKDNYGFLVAGSKVGGLVSAGLAWFLLSLKDVGGKQWLSDALNHQILLVIFSGVILLVPCVIYFLTKHVPDAHLHGYKAVYDLEKEQEKDKKDEEKPGLFSGLLMIIKRPYILGMFGMVFFYEVLNTILGYQRLAVAENASDSVTALSSLLYLQMFVMHGLGLIISLFGTRALLRRLGETTCLILIPVVSGALLMYFWSSYSPFALLLVFVITKSVNYGFTYPVREALYIPTVKDIKFKSKSWIDAFGREISRGTGSAFNVISDKVAPWLYFPFQGIFFVGIIMGWVATAVFLGKKYTKTVENNEVIT